MYHLFWIMPHPIVTQNVLIASLVFHVWENLHKSGNSTLTIASGEAVHHTQHRLSNPQVVKDLNLTLRIFGFNVLHMDSNCWNVRCFSYNNLPGISVVPEGSFSRWYYFWWRSSSCTLFFAWRSSINGSNNDLGTQWNLVFNRKAEDCGSRMWSTILLLAGDVLSEGNHNLCQALIHLGRCLVYCL